MSALWQLHELQETLDLPLGEENIGINGVAINSRELAAGDLFIALRDKRDGHEFVNEAAAAGAAAVLVDHDCGDIGIPQLVVEDTLAALWKLGEAARARSQAKFIAVTGSCGKTSTKEMIARMLGAHAPVHSFNNKIGVPVTLLRTPKDTAYAVMELGMNQSGEIAPLAQLVKPDVAIVTNVQPVHLAAFNSLDDIRREKLSIVEGLNPDGTLVVPENLDLGQLEWEGNITRFAFGSGEVFAQRVKQGATWEVSASVQGDVVDFSLTPGGMHRVMNALAALAACSVVGADITACAAYIGDVSVMPGRGVPIEVGPVTVIDDSFNANPASVRVALESLRQHEGARRRFVFLGDMLELGNKSDQYHRDLMEDCEGLNGVYCVGEYMRHLYDALPTTCKWGYSKTAGEVDLNAITQSLRPGDVILVKGSKKIFWVHEFVNKLTEALKKQQEAA